MITELDKAELEHKVSIDAQNWKFDSLYKIPDYIAAFIKEAEEKLPYGFR